MAGASVRSDSQSARSPSSRVTSCRAGGSHRPGRSSRPPCRRWPSSGLAAAGCSPPHPTPGRDAGGGPRATYQPGLTHVLVPPTPVPVGAHSGSRRAMSPQRHRSSTSLRGGRRGQLTGRTRAGSTLGVAAHARMMCLGRVTGWARPLVRQARWVRGTPCHGAWQPRPTTRPPDVALGALEGQDRLALPHETDDDMRWLGRSVTDCWGPVGWFAATAAEGSR